MIKFVCNGCKITQDAVHTTGFIPKPLIPWIHLRQKIKDSNGISTTEKDIHLCEDCANKVHLR